jgi:NAD(P)-dependent dehydrogenase (short-subunit alcohol dehydrogenase family)
VYWTQDLLQADLLREEAKIFAMTSSGSIGVWPSYGAVSAAKSALESHIRQLALELAPKKITANAILAGVTLTPALDKIPGAEQIIQTARTRNPSGRLTLPIDVAQAILALSATGTHWITGNTIRVDGGETITG